MKSKQKAEQHKDLVSMYCKDDYHMCYHNAKDNFTILCKSETNRYITIEGVTIKDGYKNKYI